MSRANRATVHELMESRVGRACRIIVARYENVWSYILNRTVAGLHGLHGYFQP